MKNVYLIPGLLTSQLGIVADSRILWWDPNELVLTGIAPMRLAPNGVDPGPPDGQAMAVDARPPSPWGAILLTLGFQLDQREWRLACGPWDWRKSIVSTANVLANSIRAQSTPASPATIVGHSAGGLVAVLAWKSLVASGETDKVRRIITIGAPFQGSYQTIEFLAGVSPSAEQMVNIGQLSKAIETGTFNQFRRRFMNALVLTWPSFYELMPSLIGPEARTDPNRTLLFNAANYPALVSPSEDWLDYARTSFQPAVAALDTFPPAWVATYVAGYGVSTRETLGTRDIPLDLENGAFTFDGDGVVTKQSASRGPGVNATVIGAHASLPLGITITGLLKQLIVDPRGPIDPTPPDIFSKVQIAENVTDPPQSDPVDTLTCIGGHC